LSLKREHLEPSSSWNSRGASVLNTDKESTDLVIPLERVNPDDVERHGGKTTNLARLLGMGFRVPRGFSVSSLCFARMIEDIPQLSNLITTLENTDDYEEMLELAVGIQSLINPYEIPDDTKLQIANAFQNLKNETGDLEHGFAVRSSATIEDRSDISFAGQAESYLCIRETEGILDAVKRVWMSGFSPRAVIYLHTKGIPLSQMKMGVFVQEMLPVDVSGVTFTANVVTNSRDEMLINSTWGIGDTIVSGKIVPDTYLLNKSPLGLMGRELGTKEKTSRPEIVEGGVKLMLIDTPQEKRKRFSLSDDALMKVAELGIEIEKKIGSPQDIEWCMKDGEIVILQTRPITTLH
jgi:pyruvate,water dikinase